MVHGGAHRQMPGGFCLRGYVKGRHVPVAGVISHRLGHRPEHQPNAHARREQHGEPRQPGELRLCVLATEPDPAHRHKRQRNGKHHEDIGTENQEPVEVVDDAVLGSVQKRFGFNWKHQRADDKNNHQNRRDRKHGRV